MAADPRSGGQPARPASHRGHQDSKTSRFTAIKLIAVGTAGSGHRPGLQGWRKWTLFLHDCRHASQRVVLAPARAVAALTEWAGLKRVRAFHRATGRRSRGTLCNRKRMTEDRGARGDQPCRRDRGRFLRFDPLMSRLAARAQDRDLDEESLSAPADADGLRGQHGSRPATWTARSCGGCFASPIPMMDAT